MAVTHDVKPGDLWVWDGTDYVVPIRRMFDEEAPTGAEEKWYVWVIMDVDIEHATGCKAQFAHYMWGGCRDEYWYLVARAR